MNGLDKTTWRRKAQFLGTTALSPPARLLAAPVLGVALLAAAPAAANPTGGVVVGGTAVATITDVDNGSGFDTTIDQTADRAVIDWTSFGITTFETTTFNQPGAGSIALNRVTGGAQSTIFGNLNANGQVWLINPNGVVMGSSAMIDTGGFLATTANIDNADFTDGNDVFNFNTASASTDAVVKNAGSITVADTGLVALMAPGVENSGTITATLGTVMLGGVETYTLDLTGGLVAFSLGSAVSVKPTGVVAHQTSSTGNIFADGGSVTLTAKAASAAVFSGFGVNMAGVIQARSVGTKNGSVVLSGNNDSVSVNGTIDVRGLLADETGGTVDIDGTLVTFGSGIDSIIDVTGAAGGGSIDATATTGDLEIGGDLFASGGRVTLAAAGSVEQTWATSEIVADTLDLSGGTATSVVSILQTDGTMTATGATTLSAAGMIGLISTGGNAFSGPVTISAGNLVQFRNGASVATTTFGDVSTGAGKDLTVFLDGGGAVQEAGTSVTAAKFTLTANGDVTLMEAGNDVANLSVGPIATGSFAFRDANVFTMSGAISATDVTLASGGALSVTNNITATSGDVTLASGGLLTVNQDITATSGNVSLSGAGVTFSGITTVDAGAGTLAVDGGTGTIATAAGSLLLSTGTVDLAADEIELAAGSQTGGSALAIGQAATVILRSSSAGQNVEVAGAGGSAGALDLTVAEIETVRSTDLRLGDPTGGSLLVADAWTPVAGTAPGVLTLASGGNISQAAGATIDLSVSGSNLILRAGTGVTLDDVANDFNRVAGVSPGGSINLTDANTITISALTDDLGTVSGLNAPGGYTLTATSVVWEVAVSPLPGNAPDFVSVPPQAEAAAGKVCDPTSSGPGKGGGGTAACGGSAGGASGKKEELLTAEGLEIAGLE